MVTLADPSSRPGHTDLRGLLWDGAQDGGHDHDGKTHCRITLGTMEEMQKALAVFGEVLGQNATPA